MPSPNNLQTLQLSLHTDGDNSREALIQSNPIPFHPITDRRLSGRDDWQLLALSSATKTPENRESSRRLTLKINYIGKIVCMLLSGQSHVFSNCGYCLFCCMTTKQTPSRCVPSHHPTEQRGIQTFKLLFRMQWQGFLLWASRRKKKKGSLKCRHSLQHIKI